MNWCNKCQKNVKVKDEGGRNSTSLWCVECGNRVDGCKPKYTAKYFGQLMKNYTYDAIVYSLEFDGETVILRKDQLETFAKVEGIDLEFQEQRYVVESLKDLNLFITMLTDLRDLHHSKKITTKEFSEIFDNLMMDVVGYSQIISSARWFGSILKKHGLKPNFYVPLEEKQK